MSAGFEIPDVLPVLERSFPVSWKVMEQDRCSFAIAAGGNALVFCFHALPRTAAGEPEFLREALEKPGGAAGRLSGEQASAGGGQAPREAEYLRPAANAGPKTDPEIRKIHIWEDQWKRQQRVILSRLAALLGLSDRIHGRQTSVKRVDAPAALQFFGNYHLQVPLKGKYRFGLFRQEELVSLAAFSGGRLMKSRGSHYRSFELLRFCHAGSLLVVGGLGKLLTAFAREFMPDDIMTYVDLDWSEGRAFEGTGFQPSGRTLPQVFWINPAECIRYYPGHLPAGLENAGTAQLHRAGYFRVCNSGSLKMIKRYG